MWINTVGLQSHSKPLRRLKIAIFSDSALPVLNGVSVSVDALVGALRARGHSVFLYTSSFPGHRDSDPNVTRFFSIHLPWTKEYPLAIPPFYFWFHEFKRRNFDIVHTHTPFTVGFVGLRWAQSCEIPVVTTYHTHYDKYVHYVPVFPKPFLRYKIAKHTNFYYNCMRWIFTPSEASKSWLLKHSVNVPITVVPTGVQEGVATDRIAVRKELGISPLSKIMLFVGRLAIEKNIGLLLQSVRLVFESEPNSELWILGDGPMRNEAQQLARQLGIGDRVRFFGFVERRELNRYYGAADVFTFCSKTETQGLVVTEAMTYGLPAVVVSGGGAQDSVDDGVNGYVVENSEIEVSQAVLKLFSDPILHARMSEAALESSKTCTVQAMVDKILEGYFEVLDGSSLKEGSYVS